MSDLFTRLRKIDNRRATLNTYAQHIKLARILAPDLERRMQYRIDRRFNDLTRERRQLLELIKADPVLRKRLFDQEEAARKSAEPKPAPAVEKERER